MFFNNTFIIVQVSLRNKGVTHTNTLALKAENVNPKNRLYRLTHLGNAFPFVLPNFPLDRTHPHASNTKIAICLLNAFIICRKNGIVIAGIVNNYQFKITTNWCGNILPQFLRNVCGARTNDNGNHILSFHYSFYPRNRQKQSLP